MKAPEFQRFLQFQRKALGMSQSQMASKLQYKYDRISNVERGVDPIPKKYIQRWLEILGIPKHMAIKRIMAEQEKGISEVIYGFSPDSTVGEDAKDNRIGDFKIGNVTKRKREEI